MPVFKIHHITKYQYNSLIIDSANEIKLFPIEDDFQRIISQDLKISNSPILSYYNDFFGNKNACFSLLAPHSELNIESYLTVEVKPKKALDKLPNIEIEKVLNAASQDLNLLLLSKQEDYQFLHEIEAIIQNLNLRALSLHEIANAINQYIFSNFTYLKGMTNIETTVDEILTHRSGVCQDFAHIMLAILRKLGIPSRYVAGYICPNKDGFRGEGATHAWVEYFCPELGWVGVDPTNNCLVNEYHVRIAVGRDFKDCTVAKGIFKGNAQQELFLYVSVGYEDGHVIESTNQVLMERIAGESIMQQIATQNQ
jgi:transglutaminase-like putative cysteine protease